MEAEDSSISAKRLHFDSDPETVAVYGAAMSIIDAKNKKLVKTKGKTRWFAS